MRSCISFSAGVIRFGYRKRCGPTGPRTMFIVDDVLYANDGLIKHGLRKIHDLLLERLLVMAAFTRAGRWVRQRAYRT